MASYTIATETALTDERLRQIYNTVKAGIIHFSYVPYKIGKLQIQGFSESTTPTKTKQSYHITQKAAQSRPRAAFLRGRLGRRQDFSKK